MLGELDADTLSCAKRLESGDPVRFRAVMSSPVLLRKRLFVLFAFNAEVARAPWVTQESPIAEMRLQWWWDALEEISKGESIRRHDVVTPLSQLIKKADAPSLQRLVNARRLDIYKECFKTLDDFEAYIKETSSILLSVASSLEKIEETHPVYRLGYAAGLANFLAAYAALEQKGWNAFQISIPDLVKRIVPSALKEYKSALKDIKKLSLEARFACLSTYQTGQLLTSALRDPDRVSSGRLRPNRGKDSFLLLAHRLFR